MTEQERIELALQCPDIEYFSPVVDGGCVVEKDGRRVQKTHYGWYVLADCYYGAWMTELISLLHGIHEPQEEKVFAEILPALPEAPQMLELGGYWAFYSLWLKAMRPSASVAILEPIDERRLVGEANFALNNVQADFIRGAIGEAPGYVEQFENGPATSANLDIFSVDQIIKNNGWSKVDILHADIQGHEYKMLRGAKEALSNKTINWILISTHRWLEDGKNLDLHEACLDILTDAGYQIVAAHTPEESYTVDGLIAAKSPDVDGVESVAISKYSGASAI